MAERPAKGTGDGLEETRAALAPTLEATAAILPWLAKPRPVRFPPALNKRWEAACAAITERWGLRHTEEATALRPAIFALLGIALETADVDCLRLGEALASVADRLEEGPPGPRLTAALSATCEALSEPGGLESPAFVSRARHFAQRLENSLQTSHKPGERSDVLDRLFIHDTEERLERMREALAALPIDVYSLQLESREMMLQAQEISMYGILHLSQQLADFVALMNEAGEAEQDRARTEIATQLETIAAALAAVDG